MTHSRTMRRTQRAAAVALVAAILAAVVSQDSGIAAAVALEPPTLHVFGVAVSLIGLSSYMLVASASALAVASLSMLRAGSPDRRSRARIVAGQAAFVFSAVAVSGLLCQVVKHTTGRARPVFFDRWGAFHFDGLSLRSGIDSFPSGHATSVFAAAVALGLLFPVWRRPLLALAILVCVARVLAGAHYPSDTVAGAFLGSVVALWLARSFAARGLALPTVAPDPAPPLKAPERVAS